MATKANPDVALAAQVADLYLAGGTTRSVGEAVGRSDRWVSTVLKQLDVPLRSPGWPGKDETHPRWKGNEVGYSAAHRRVYKHRGKADHCVECGAHDERAYHWANLTGDYWDLNDYQPMCVPCHRLLDNQFPPRFSG